MDNITEILEKNKKLEELNKEKDLFFSIISHDLRSPFSSILGLLGILGESFEKLTEKEKKECVEIAHQSAKNFHDLLENLLFWVESQRDGSTPDYTDFYILIEVKKISNDLEELLKSKSVSLEIEIPLIHCISYDILAFKSILRNLISNAIKFTPISGTVKIFSKKISEDFIEISVSDTGIGMNEKILGEIFKMSSIKKKRRGTFGEISCGFGLLIAKNLIEKGGGKLTACSEGEGKGSTFSFTIPIS